jgi:hypothetical protein
MKIYPYVYKCTHKITGQFYLGYREANVSLARTAEVDMPLYKTSSKKIHDKFHEYHWEIIAVMFTGEYAYELEQLLIREEWDNPLCINGNISGKFRRDNNGMVVVKDSNQNIFRVSVNHPKYLSGEYEYYAKGIQRTDEFKRKQSVNNKGKVNMKNVDGKIIKVLVTDPRIESGELTPMNLGSTRTKDTKQKQSTVAKGPKPKLVCRIYDKKEMDIANYTRWANGNYVGNKEPKIKCCRLSDRKVISVNYLNRGI